jgi:hypothetical protein
MKITALDIAGSFLIELEPLGDDRGFFARTYCAATFAAAGVLAAGVVAALVAGVGDGSAGIGFLNHVMDELNEILLGNPIDAGVRIGRVGINPISACLAL